jgi:aminoglycoside 6'-N-acetyltransferase
MNIIFTSLAESHFPLLLKWLETSHIKAWWDQDAKWTPKLIQEKYADYVKGYKTVILNSVPVQRLIHAFIIEIDDLPIGYIQYYNAYDFLRDNHILKVLPKSLAVLDAFVGEMDYFGSDIGLQSVLLFLEEHVFKNYDYVLVEPDVRNLSAITSYKKYGFKELDKTTLGTATLMIKAKVLKREGESQYNLPPRTHDISIIASVLKRKPIKVEHRFCNMCDSNINYEWFGDEDYLQCELRHLVDLGYLRFSEFKILVNALELGELDYFWENKPKAIIQPIPQTFVQPTLILLSLLLKLTFNKIKSSLYNLHIYYSKNNWYLSKNHNFYNPTLEATVYEWGPVWHIARYNIHHTGFKSKKEAMQVAFEMWLLEKETRNTLYADRQYIP